VKDGDREAHRELLALLGVRHLDRRDQPADGGGALCTTNRSSGDVALPPERAPSAGTPSGVEQVVDPQASEVSAASAAPRETLEAIRQDLGDCRRCQLAKRRKKIVFGEGDPRARLFFVGEGPGASEDATGRPFVGAAGKLLDKMIVAMGLARSDVFIGNVVKCRPPENRVPEKGEVAACTPFLVRQIESVRPEVVCALGLTAARHLLGGARSLASLRGDFRDLTIGSHRTWFLATFHPAYLLRSPQRKRDAWDDLKRIMAFLGLSAGSS